jgi:hypothetical protein
MNRELFISLGEIIFIDCFFDFRAIITKAELTYYIFTFVHEPFIENLLFLSFCLLFVMIFIYDEGK